MLEVYEASLESSWMSTHVNAPPPLHLTPAFPAEGGMEALPRPHPLRHRARRKEVCGRKSRALILGSNASPIRRVCQEGSVSMVRHGWCQHHQQAQVQEIVHPGANHHHTLLGRPMTSRADSRSRTPRWPPSHTMEPMRYAITFSATGLWLTSTPFEMQNAKMAMSARRADHLCHVKGIQANIIYVYKNK
jgi:hypothetical protein